MNWRQRKIRTPPNTSVDSFSFPRRDGVLVVLRNSDFTISFCVMTRAWRGRDWGSFCGVLDEKRRGIHGRRCYEPARASLASSAPETDKLSEFEEDMAITSGRPRSTAVEQSTPA